MKNIHKLYLNHFIQYFIGFALISWSFELFEVSQPVIISVIIKSAIFGIILSWTTVIRFIKDLKNKGLNSDDENLKIKHEKVIFSQNRMEEILLKITQNVDFKKMKIIKTKNGYKINTNYSWNYWGEIIEINFENINSEKQRIIISSRPKSPLTLIDNGKNKENVEKISALIKNVA